MKKTGGGNMEDNQTMQDYLFDFAYGEALRDAINQQSFKGEKNYLYECETGKNEVRTYINAILNGEHPSFIDAEKKVEEQFNKFIKSQRRERNQVFSFGNTQKLINMTVKYLFISAYAQNYEEFKKLFADCHCPLDRLMAGMVREEFDQADDEAAQVIKEESSDIYKKINKDITWSKVDKETYNCYQQMVRLLAERENLIPIEYDFVKWGTSKS